MLLTRYRFRPIVKVFQYIQIYEALWDKKCVLVVNYILEYTRVCTILFIIIYYLLFTLTIYIHIILWYTHLLLLIVSVSCVELWARNVGKYHKMRPNLFNVVVNKLILNMVFRTSVGLLIVGLFTNLRLSKFTSL